MKCTIILLRHTFALHQYCEGKETGQIFELRQKLFIERSTNFDADNLVFTLDKDQALIFDNIDEAEVFLYKIHKGGTYPKYGIVSVTQSSN